MSQTLVARRYARATYEQAASTGSVEKVASDLDALAALLTDSRELKQLFLSPVVPQDRKKAVVDKLLDERMDPLVIRLLHMLLDRGRESLVPQITGMFRQLHDERLGRIEAIVQTPTPLSDSQASTLQTALEKTTGRNVVLNIQINPALISGLSVRVGDVVYDGSARHQLATLRDQFATRTFLSN